MTEDEFWDRLEFLACDELERIEASRALGLWCDGFIRDAVSVAPHPATVRGRAWIARGGRGGQDQWPFELTLRQRPSDPASIDWAAALPCPDEVGWLRVDTVGKRLWLSPPPTRVPPGTTTEVRVAGLEHEFDELLKLAQRHGGAEVLGDDVAADRLVRLVRAMTHRFGEPDPPADWRAHFAVPEEPFVVWDFDHYVLSLRLHEQQLILTWHRPEEPP